MRDETSIFVEENMITIRKCRVTPRGALLAEMKIRVSASRAVVVHAQHEKNANGCGGSSRTSFSGRLSRCRGRSCHPAVKTKRTKSTHPADCAVPASRAG